MTALAMIIGMIPMALGWAKAPSRTRRSGAPSSAVFCSRPSRRCSSFRWCTRPYTCGSISAKRAARLPLPSGTSRSVVRTRRPEAMSEEHHSELDGRLDDSGGRIAQAAPDRAPRQDRRRSRGGVAGGRRGPHRVQPHVQFARARSGHARAGQAIREDRFPEERREPARRSRCRGRCKATCSRRSPRARAAT